MVEQEAVNFKVRGSNPRGGAIIDYLSKDIITELKGSTNLGALMELFEFLLL